MAFHFSIVLDVFIFITSCNCLRKGKKSPFRVTERPFKDLECTFRDTERTFRDTEWRIIKEAMTNTSGSNDNYFRK